MTRQLRRAGVRQGGEHQAAPRAEWEKLRIGPARHEVERQPVAFGGRAQATVVENRPGQIDAAAVQRGFRCHRHQEDRLRGEDAGRRGLRRESFHDQDVVGSNRGVAGNAEQLRKPPRGWQSGAGRDHATPNRLAQLGGELHRQRFRTGSVKQDR